MSKIYAEELTFLDGHVKESWEGSEIKESIERFYASLDEKNIQDVITRIHDYPNAIFTFLSHVFQGNGIGAALEADMVTMGNTYKTEIQAVKCSEILNENELEIEARGKVSLNGGEPTEFKSFLTFVKTDEGQKVVKCDRVI
ncbi:hypothetical protein DFH28DRAFT_1029343 [Melampsora americana]|nr:hypothetical protein DFH28DRAFT_1029343 [Melampsora americana]